MIDFLASVDPMTLPLWAVVLFAASMYPMGFLFGTCSECCDECSQPCNKCNRAYDYPDAVGVTQDCARIKDLRMNVGSGYTFAYCTPGTANTTADDACSLECYAYKPQYTSGGWGGPTPPPCMDGFTFDNNPDTGVFLFDQAGIVVSVECECLRPSLFVAGRFSRYFFSNFEVVLEFSCTIDLLDCTTASFTLHEDSLVWSVADFPTVMNDCYGDVYASFLNPLIEYIKTIPITIELSVDPCDCGACCDAGCEDNIPEGGCTNWAGAGTACNDTPSPCA